MKKYVLKFAEYVLEFPTLYSPLSSVTYSSELFSVRSLIFKEATVEAVFLFFLFFFNSIA